MSSWWKAETFPSLVASSIHAAMSLDVGPLCFSIAIKTWLLLRSFRFRAGIKKTLHRKVWRVSSKGIFYWAVISGYWPLQIPYLELLCCCFHFMWSLWMNDGIWDNESHSLLLLLKGVLETLTMFNRCPVHKPNILKGCILEGDLWPSKGVYWYKWSKYTHTPSQRAVLSLEFEGRHWVSSKWNKHRLKSGIFSLKYLRIIERWYEKS